MKKSSPEPGGAAGRVLDELLTLPTGEFTAARNAAAKQLLADGHRAAAAEIKSLPRQPVSVWLLNQLAREQPALIAEFLAAAEQLREAYRSGGDIRAATAPQRSAEARVVAGASELARERSANVTETVSRGLRQTLDAAAADAEVAGELRAGRLLREPEAPSIDALLESLPESSTKASSARDSKRRTLQEELSEAEGEASGARGDARAALDAEGAARREWEQAQKLAERAKKRSAAAEERLEKLRRRLRDM